MALTTSTDYTVGTPPVRPDSDADPIEPTTQIYALFLAFFEHTHAPGRGKPIPPEALTGDVIKKVWHFALVGD